MQVSDTVKTREYDGLQAGETTNGLTRYLEMPFAEIRRDVVNHKDKPMTVDDQNLAHQLQPTCHGEYV